jgi:hypothetical protein
VQSVRECLNSKIQARVLFDGKTLYHIPQRKDLASEIAARKPLLTQREISALGMKKILNDQATSIELGSVDTHFQLQKFTFDYFLSLNEKSLGVRVRSEYNHTENFVVSF